jgi:hypothetical protein
MLSRIPQKNNTYKYIYYDLDVLNYDITDGAPKKLEFNVQRTTDVIHRPQDYKMSIVRFQCDNKVPVFIPLIEIGQMDINKTIYKITMEYKTFSYTKIVQFYPQNILAPLANIPIDYQDIETSNYYEIDSLEFATGIFNDAFKQCLTGLNALVVAGGDTLPSQNAPFLEYDNDGSGKWSAYFDISGYNMDGSIPNPIKVYGNDAFCTLWDLFPYINLNPAGVKSRQFNVRNMNNTNVILGTYTLLMLEQDYSITPARMTPVSSLVFVSNSLPVQPNMVDFPTLFGSSAGNKFISNPTLQIITDISLIAEGATNWNGQILYNPTAEYRWVSLMEGPPIRNVQLQAFIKYKFGVYKPLFLPNGGFGSLKLLFEKID